MTTEELAFDRASFQIMRIRGTIRKFRFVRDIEILYNILLIKENFLSSDLKKKKEDRFEDSILFLM